MRNTILKYFLLTFGTFIGALIVLGYTCTRLGTLPVRVPPVTRWVVVDSASTLQRLLDTTHHVACYRLIINATLSCTHYWMTGP